MIHALTPNPAIDVTYELAEMRLGEVNRLSNVQDVPGGKGVNVARVIAALGQQVTVGGFLGGPSGQWLSDALGANPLITQRWTPITGQTRRTINTVDLHGATVLNEPGPQVGPDEWVALTDTVLATLAADDVVVLSGSTPPGTPEQAAADLVRAVRDRGARVIVDTSGPALLAVAAAGADVLKPNAEELREATGAPGVLGGAQQLLEAGAGSVVVSLGEEGMLVVLPGPIQWRARPAAVLQGNPTGAGDACVAALARALAQQSSTTPLSSYLPEALRDAVALSGAAVLCPVAGDVDVDAYRRMRPDTTLEEIHATR